MKRCGNYHGARQTRVNATGFAAPPTITIATVKVSSEGVVAEVPPPAPRRSNVEISLLFGLIKIKKILRKTPKNKR